VRVLRGRVWVRMQEQPSSIIHLVESNPRETTFHRGTVLAIGPGAFSKGGVPVDLPIAVGDEVGFHFEGTQRGREAPWTDGKTALCLAQRELDCVFE
jgi:co-chaperonin GroES (HSP10)